MEIPVLEMPDTVVFPGMTLMLSLTGPKHVRLLKQVLERDEHGFMISWTGRSDGERPPQLPEHGTKMAVLAVKGNDREGYSVTAHGQGRQLLKLARSESVPDPEGGRSSLLYVHDEPAPLGRTDPGEELLEAWDAVELFRRYAQRFFHPEVQEEISEALPPDPLYVASFICANTLLEPEQQQQLLAAETLLARLRLVSHMISCELDRSEPAQPGPA